jgi:hypothetical protein
MVKAIQQMVISAVAAGVLVFGIAALPVRVQVDHFATAHTQEQS